MTAESNSKFLNTEEDKIRKSEEDELKQNKENVNPLSFLIQ